MSQRGEDKQSLWFLNTRVNIVVSTSTGSDHISILRHWAPFADSPPLHVHDTEDEVFHILEGQLRFRVGDDEHEVGVGETLLAPKGVPHTYCVESTSGCSLMTITAVGDFERFVRRLSRPAESDGLPPPAGAPTPEQMQALVEVARLHHIKIVGPPMAPRRSI